MPALRAALRELSARLRCSTKTPKIATGKGGRDEAAEKADVVAAGFEAAYYLDTRLPGATGAETEDSDADSDSSDGSESEIESIGPPVGAVDAAPLEMSFRAAGRMAAAALETACDDGDAHLAPRFTKDLKRASAAAGAASHWWLWLGLCGISVWCTLCIAVFGLWRGAETASTLAGCFVGGAFLALALVIPAGDAMIAWSTLCSPVTSPPDLVSAALLGAELDAAATACTAPFALAAALGGARGLTFARASLALLDSCSSGAAFDWLQCRAQLCSAAFLLASILGSVQSHDAASLNAPFCAAVASAIQAIEGDDTAAAAAAAAVVPLNTGSALGLNLNPSGDDEAAGPNRIALAANLSSANIGGGLSARIAATRRAAALAAAPAAAPLAASAPLSSAVLQRVESSSLLGRAELPIAGVKNVFKATGMPLLGARAALARAGNAVILANRAFPGPMARSLPPAAAVAPLVTSVATPVQPDDIF
jgi:hypothetical protein